MAATFSYAQAARGLVAPSSNSAPTTKPPSEQSPDLTPKAADTQPNESQMLNAEAPKPAAPLASHLPTSGQNTAISQEAKLSSPLLNGVSPPDSPEYGVSSTSTLLKDDDQSSAVNTSSESTWENKSQVSGVADITNGEPNDKGSEKPRSHETEQQGDVEGEAPPAKPLHEAPPPVVNIWKQRAEQRAANVPSPTKPNVPVKREVTASSKSHSLPEGNLAVAPRITPPKDRKPESAPSRHQSEPRTTGSKGEDNARGRRSQVPRAASHETSSPVSTPQAPPRDQESWPTPDTATEEERKKSVEKVEKPESKDKPEEENTEKKKAHGKSAWTHVPFTPTVVFSTPLPGTGRRGGRGGGRGGREETARRSSNTTAGNAPATTDDKKGAATALTNGDNSRRTRPESAARSTSPAKGKPEQNQSGAVQTPSQQATTPSEAVVTKADATNGEPGGLPNGHSRRFSVDRAANSVGPSLRGSGARGRGRRGDFGSSNDRRRDPETGSIAGEQPLGPGQKPAQFDAADRRKKSISEDVLSPSKQQSFDRRNGGFGSFPGPRERGEPRPRGGARGRGGSHHFQASQQFGNSQYAPSSTSGVPQPYGYPASSPPPGWPQGQAGAYFAPPPQHARGFRAGNQRAQSIPTELNYGQFGAPYAAAPSPMLPIQTQFGFPYDPQSTPQSLSASGYGPYAEQFSLFAMVATQLEYYFSVDNLIKDVYLRRHMDSQGFVHLSVIANFSRMKKLTTDLDLIKYACANSRTVEWRVTSDGKDYLRPVGDWQQWVMPVEERDSAARNDGPSELFIPNMPVPQGFDSYGMQIRHSIGGPLPHSAAAASAPWHQVNGGRVSQSQSPMSPQEAAYGQVYAPPPHQPLQNGYDGREQFAAHSSTTNGPNHGTNPEADTFSDTAAAKLMVVVGNTNEELASTPPATEHTGPNGFIDGSQPAHGSEASKAPESLQAENGEDSHRGRSGHTTQVSSVSHGSAQSMDGSKICWTKSDDCTSHVTPGREQTERYPILREQALHERADAPEGACPHNLIVLYKFWSHFLLRNFNTNMYNEFRHLALQDYHERQTDVGYHNLLKYYRHALASTDSTIRDRVAKHYVQLAQAERQNDNDQEQVAFKQLRGQWKDDALDQRNRDKLGEHLSDELKATFSR